ncbi:limonene hydroxylase [Brevibacillus dissolubilis]|uniref:limonene hydroxylase n=1 Tax=Brevibacillus dissolubilis TaxID=1844116 RepID=UPI0011175565|nr:limonene hydroxylase [Brevibacillus dissolubilis]
MFSFFKSKSEVLPWYGKTPIIDYIRSHLNEKGEMPREYEELPDAAEMGVEGKAVRFAAGAMDGILGHHMGAEADEGKLRSLIDTFSEQLRNPSNKTRRATYVLLMERGVLSVIDDFLHRVRNRLDFRPLDVYEEALWFIYHGAHREVVKFGIALLGLFEIGRDRELLLTLGKHEEFTLYVAAALTSGMHEPNETLFQLAKSVHGWGRIHLVERLEPQTQEIRDWMLREGFKNEIMDEYLALTCAVGGDLRSAMAAETIDEELYQSAGSLIASLIHEGPSVGITGYDHAAEVIGHYLRHAYDRAETLRDFLWLVTICNYLRSEGEQDWSANDWTPAIRAQHLEQCETMVDWKGWHDRLRQEAATISDDNAHIIINAAHALRVDVWDNLYAALLTNPDKSMLYDYLMQTSDRNQAEKVVTFAISHLPLEKIATGPARELGLGLGFNHHNCLGSILQHLSRFLGLGHQLIQTALMSPVVRNRSAAIHVLEEWEVDVWRKELLPMMKKLLETEPDADVGERLIKLVEKA